MHVPITSSFVSSAQAQVWLLPDGGPQARTAPWLDHWQAVHGHARLEQHDWRRPLRGDWSARLQETLVDAPGPVVLVASGLGCILTAWWAAHSPLASKVRGALLVAPVDVEQLRDQLPGWSPIARQRLPFPSVLVGHGQALAQAWGSTWVAPEDANEDLTSNDWPAGLALLQTLLKD